jgi:hypothetical protein
MPSRLRLRLLLPVFLASVGTAAVAVHVSGASAQVQGACGSHSVPTLSVSRTRTSRVMGSVLVAAAGRRITVGASRRSETGLRSTSAAAWLEFCLRPGAVTKSVTLVRVAPSGVTVSLTREGRLTVSDAVRGTKSTMAVVAAATHDELLLGAAFAGLRSAVGAGRERYPHGVRGDEVALRPAAAGGGHRAFSRVSGRHAENRNEHR